MLFLADDEADACNQTDEHRPGYEAELTCLLALDQSLIAREEVEIDEL